MARVFSLAGRDDIDLTPTGRGSPQIATNAKENDFGDVPKVEADASAIRAAIFTNLIPDKLCLIGEAPTLHGFQTFENERVGYPEIQMTFRERELGDRKLIDVIHRHGFIA